MTDLYDRLGFDTVNVGPLSESWRVERDRPAYVVRQNAESCASASAKAARNDCGHRLARSLTRSAVPAGG